MKTKLIVILSLLVLGLSGYMLYDSINNEMSQAEIQTQFSDLKSDYEFIQKDLEVAINDIDFNNQEIIEQKKKIDKLVTKNHVTQEELLEAKKIMRNISQTFIKNYKGKIIVLETDNVKLIDQKIKLQNEKELVAKEVAILKEEVNDLDKKVIKEKRISEKKDELISYASKLTLSNFSLKSFKVRDSGKEVETDKASRIDRIKVSFDVNENLLANSGEKLIYTVIKKPNGETVTFTNKKPGIINYNNKKLLYSDNLTFNYDKDKEQTLEFVWDNEEFSRGNYILEVYEDNNNKIVQIGKVTKTLE